MAKDNCDIKTCKLSEKHPYPVLSISKNGEILYSNKPAQAFLRNLYATDQVFLDNKWKELVYDVCDSGKPREIEEELSGSFFSLTAIPIKGQEYVNLYALDITKRIEESKNNEFKLSQYFDNLPIMAYNIDLEGNILNCNQMVLDTLGYTTEKELIGKKLFSTIYAPASGTKAKKLLSKWKETGKLKNEEVQILTKDGRVVDVLLNVSAILDRNGNPIYGLSTQIDTSERKRFASKLKADQEEIKENRQKLCELTEQLSTIKEHETKRIAAEIHDKIIQPLIFLDIKMKSLDSTTEKTASKQDFKEIRKILGQLIDRSRSITLELNDPVLNELGLENAIKEYINTELEEKHNIKTDFKYNVKEHYLSPSTMTFVYKSVKELLVNALKHANAKQIWVSIEEKKKNLVVYVKDDGQGFRTALDCRKNATTSGFGLCYIREKALACGGHLKMLFNKNAGCQIFLTIPLKGTNNYKGRSI